MDGGYKSNKFDKVNNNYLRLGDGDIGDVGLGIGVSISGWDWLGSFAGLNPLVAGICWDIPYS